MCLAISTVTPSVGMGNLVAILLLFFFLLFGGFLIQVQSMPGFMRWIVNLSFIYYG